MTERGSRFDEGMTRAEMERGSSAPGRSPRPTPRPKKKFQEGGQVSTRRMPSGAQQYVRESAELGPRAMSTPTTRRMKTIDETIRATRGRNPESEIPLNEAFADESNLFRTSLRTERQTSDEDRANRRADRRGAQKFAEGGMVTGTGSRAQISGTKFSGTF
jgi:hypothetical protein